MACFPTMIALALTALTGLRHLAGSVTVTLSRMRSDIIFVRTGSRETVLDITRQCAAFVSAENDGLLNVFVPHATAGVAVLETGAGSDDDLLTTLAGLLPADDRWRHAHGSPGHGRSHVLPALISPSTTVPVLAGRLALGNWQSIVVVDLNLDNEQRQVRLSFVGDDR